VRRCTPASLGKSGKDTFGTIRVLAPPPPAGRAPPKIPVRPAHARALVWRHHVWRAWRARPRTPCLACGALEYLNRTGTLLSAQPAQHCLLDLSHLRASTVRGAYARAVCCAHFRGACASWGACSSLARAARRPLRARCCGQCLR
jgi:hypothetical protein